MENQDLLRKFLLRDIANKNNRITGFLNKQVRTGSSYNDGFNEILHFFAGGKNSQVLDAINEHRETKEGKKFASYNYFDIDTLIAYNDYLQSIISEVDVVSYENGRKTASLTDYRKGLQLAQKKLRDRAGTRETGYYNPARPISLMYRYREGKRELFPIATPSKEAFERSCNVYTCRRAVELYLEQKLQAKSKSRSTHPAPEYISHIHNGRKLRLLVNKKLYYCDEQGAGIKYIEASSKDGQLFGTYRDNGSVYVGPVYDHDMRLIDAYSEGVTFYGKEPTTKYKFDKEDEDQLTFF